MDDDEQVHFVEADLYWPLCGTSKDLYYLPEGIPEAITCNRCFYLDALNAHPGLHPMPRTRWKALLSDGTAHVQTVPDYPSRPCQKGHELTPDNLRFMRGHGGWACLTCYTANRQRQYARRRQDRQLSKTSQAQSPQS